MTDGSWIEDEAMNRQRVAALYERLGVVLDGTMSVYFMWVPLLEKIVSQLERGDVQFDETPTCTKSSRRPVKQSEIT